MLLRVTHGFVLAFVWAIAFPSIGITTTVSAVNLYPGDQLTNGQCAGSDNGLYHLCYQYDDRFGFEPTYDLGWSARVCSSTQWRSPSDGSIAASCSDYFGHHVDQVGDPGPGGVAIMQGDGNFVLYDSSWNPHWATNTCCSATHLALQNDGNMVVYDNLVPVWSLPTGS
jgi:hypothetical protein